MNIMTLTAAVATNAVLGETLPFAVDAPSSRSIRRPPVEPARLRDQFRRAMSRLASPVTVITSMDQSRPHGTTVSAFASLSMVPPMVVVSLNRTSNLLAVIRDAGYFGVNILGAAQVDVATAFAQKGGPEKFLGHTWSVEYGVPRLAETCGWLACVVASLVDGGDHILVLGNVLAAEEQQRAPLTYHDRAFGTHATLAG